MLHRYLSFRGTTVTCLVYCMRREVKAEMRHSKASELAPAATGNVAVLTLNRRALGIVSFHVLREKETTLAQD